MRNPLIRRLASFSDLGADDCAVLELLCRSPGRRHARGALVEEGGSPEAAVCFLEGWGYRYIVTAEGRCQIVALLLPGDICEPYGYLLGATDYSLGVQGRAEIVIVPGPTIAGLAKQHPAIAQALMGSTMVDGLSCVNGW
jgi:CRP-like cAMP-binding protein